MAAAAAGDAGWWTEMLADTDTPSHSEERRAHGHRSSIPPRRTHTDLLRALQTGYTWNQRRRRWAEREN